MAPLPRSLFWSRTDVPGSDHVLLDEHRGLTARGVAQAVEPIGWTCRYDLVTDDGWAASRLEVAVEGAGWSRSVRLERTGTRWRVGTAESGDLDAALAAAGRPGADLPGLDEPHRLEGVRDVDLGGSPLFNTLPIRRLGLLREAPGTSHRVDVAWVLLPSLLVVPVEQVYTVLGAGSVRFAGDGFSADLAVDSSGYVLHYPGLARRSDAG
jgi:hypothetical protein